MEAAPRIEEPLGKKCVHLYCVPLLRLDVPSTSYRAAFLSKKKCCSPFLFDTNYIRGFLERHQIVPQILETS